MLFSLFVCIGIFVEPGIGAKIGYIFVVILLCPLPYLLFKSKVNEKGFALLRGAGIGIGLVLLVVTTVFWADHSLNEQKAIELTVSSLEEKYNDYDALSVKDYEIRTIEETEDTQYVSITLTFNAVKNWKVAQNENKKNIMDFYFVRCFVYKNM